MSGLGACAVLQAEGGGFTGGEFEFKDGEVGSVEDAAVEIRGRGVGEDGGGVVEGGLFGAVGEVEFEPLLTGVPVDGGSGSGGVVGEEELVVDEAVGGEAGGLAVGVTVGVDVVGEVALGEEGDLEVGGEGKLVAETVEAKVTSDVLGVVEAAAGLEEAVGNSGVFDILR